MLGEVKLSDRILFRVRLGPGARVPLLLRDASYVRYRGAVWHAGDVLFADVKPGAEALSWEFGPPREGGLAATVHMPFRKGRGLLALPNGAFRIDGLVAESLQRTRLGAVRAAGALGMGAYRVEWSPGTSLDGAPGPADLEIPQPEAAAVIPLAAELGLMEMAPREAVESLGLFFERNFRYSTVRRSKARRVSPLEDFLRRSRTGHCEYFATSTVLLLRAAGVPARYASGYSVQEYSWLERSFVVRDRHAHSWALAYVDGSWRDVDTTPPVWDEEEARAGTPWSRVWDLWSWAAHRWLDWRWRKSEGRPRRLVLFALIPALAFLGWRFYSSRRGRRAAEPGEEPAPEAGREPAPGLDSEWYEVERLLEGEGLGRRPWEPPARWLDRLEGLSGPPVETAPLRDLLALHYRHRFDPRGLAPPERDEMRRLAQAWLRERSRRPSPAATT
jgi:transglutaminase-like putative cysteine protease